MTPPPNDRRPARQVNDKPKESKPERRRRSEENRPPKSGRRSEDKARTPAAAQTPTRRDRGADWDPTKTRKKPGLLDRFKEFLSGENSASNRKPRTGSSIRSMPELQRIRSAVKPFIENLRRALIPDLQAPPPQHRRRRSRAASADPTKRGHRADNDDGHRHGHRRRRRRSASNPETKSQSGKPRANDTPDRIIAVNKHNKPAAQADPNGKGKAREPASPELKDRPVYNSEMGLFENLELKNALRQGEFHQGEHADRHRSYRATMEEASPTDTRRSSRQESRRSLADNRARRNDGAGEYVPQSGGYMLNRFLQEGHSSRQEAELEATNRHRRRVRADSEITEWPRGTSEIPEPAPRVPAVPAPAKPAAKPTAKPPVPKKDPPKPPTGKSNARQDASRRRDATPPLANSSDDSPDDDFSMSRTPNPFGRMRGTPRETPRTTTTRNLPSWAMRASSVYPEDESKPVATNDPSYHYPRREWDQTPTSPPNPMDADTAWTLNWEYDGKTRLFDSIADANPYESRHTSHRAQERDTLDEIYGTYFNDITTQITALGPEMDDPELEAIRAAELKRLEEEFDKRLRRFSERSMANPPKPGSRR